MVKRGGAKSEGDRLLSRLAVRLGVIFIALALTVIGMTFFQESIASRWSVLPWIVLLVSVGFGGIAGLRTVRTPGQIESELLRAREGAGVSVSKLRPMVGAGSIVDSWNALIEQARVAERRHCYEIGGGNSGAELGTNTVEKLPIDLRADQSSLMARAVRSISYGIAVCDFEGRILVANRPAVALLGLDGSEDLSEQGELNRCSNEDGAEREHAGGSVAEPASSVDSTDANETLASDSGSHADETIYELLRCISVLADEREPRSAAEVERKNRASQALECLHQGGGTVAVRLPVGAVDSPTMLRITRSRLQGRHEDMNGHVWVIQDVTQQALAESSRDEFLNTATHELRTPLANLLAYAEALRIEDGISVEEQKEFCNIITEEAQRLNRLVDNLLSVGQLEAGSMVIGDQRVEFTRVLEEAIDNTRPQFEANRLTVQTDISPKLRNIRGDKEKLQAMLVNVIGNAAKYTPKDGLVRIVAKMREDWLEVSVEDTGIGIGPEDLPKIFDKFYRVQSEHVQEKSGNGLGLAFAREVARLHQGDITVESRLGEGSVFTVRLPAPDDLKVGG